MFVLFPSLGEDCPRSIPRLEDGNSVLRVNPQRLCRRVSDPWMLEEGGAVSQETWEAGESDALGESVKQVGYLGWEAVKEQLFQGWGLVKTAEQCQSHWRELYQSNVKNSNSETGLRDLENRTLGLRWIRRDESILAELELLEREDLKEEPTTVRD